MQRHNNPRGFNKTKRPFFQTTKSWAAIMVLLIAPAMIGHRGDDVVKAFKHYNQPSYAAMIQPTIVPSDQPTPTATPTPTQRDLIAAEIERVFGPDAPKAFKLLACENHALNPDAVNTAGNVPAGSRDIGVFQINEYWQKTQARFLFEPDINIRIAYKIFKDNGYSFERWTCGRKLGL